MEQLQLLGVALGLATLAGLNLYLTVFVTGLAINQHWIVLSPAYQSLDVLSHPMIIVLAGVLYLLEFFADKIPWIDSAWDTVHTVIRPIGGALLALQALGETTPTHQVAVALVAGTTSLISHTAKSTTRLVANSSPEPFSNIGLSLGEDALVLGGLTLIWLHPVAALAVFAFLVALFLYFAPKLLRAFKVRLWLVLKKLNGPAGSRTGDGLPLTLSPRLGHLWSRQNLLGETIAWAAPCVSTRAPRIPANLFGALLATNEEPRKLIFLARKSGRDVFQAIALDSYKVGRDPKFLSENLVIFPSDSRGPKYTFVFDRQRAAVVEEIVAYFEEKLSAPVAEPAATEPEPASA